MAGRDGPALRTALGNPSPSVVAYLCCKGMEQADHPLGLATVSTPPIQGYAKDFKKFIEKHTRNEIYVDFHF